MRRHGAIDATLRRAQYWIVQDDGHGLHALHTHAPCSAQHRVELSALRMGGLPYESAMRHDEQRTRSMAAAAPGNVSNRVDGSAGKWSSRPGRRAHNRKTACVGASYVGRKCEKTLYNFVVTIRAVTTISAAAPGGHACRSYNAREMGQINSIDLLMGVIL